MKNWKQLKIFTLVFLLSAGLNSQAATSLKRFEPSLKFLKGLVTETAATAPNDVAAFRNLLLKKDGRKYLFRIEGLVRLYRTTEAETAKPLLRKIKQMEDAVGDYDAYREFTAYGKKINVPAAVLVVLEQQEADALQNLDSLLQKWFLQADPYVDVFALGLSQLRERSDQELIEAFKTEVRELSKVEFDLNLLDDGVHEFRRQIRWLNIYAEGLGDLFKVSIDPMIPDDFRQMDVKGDAENVIVVPKAFTRKLSKFLSDIGRLKDLAEPVEAMAMAYVNAGLASDLASAEALVQKHMESQALVYPMIFEEAKEIAAEFDTQSVLKTWLAVLGNE